MQLLSASLHKLIVEESRGSFCGLSFSLEDDSEHLLDLDFVFRSEQVGHFSSIQNIVHIFQKALLLDLDIGEEEGGGFAPSSALLEQGSHIFSPLLQSVVSLNFDLVDFKVGHLGGKTSQTLSS